MSSQGQTPEEKAADQKAFNDWQSGFDGYIGKKKKAQWWDQRNQTYRNRQAENLVAGKSSGSILSGSTKEQQGQMAGLNTALLGYGQGLGQTGQDIQGVKKSLQDRVAQGGGDPVSAAIMGQKQAAQAQARRGLAGTGARGTAMMGAIDSVGKQQDQQIAASLYGQQRQSINDYRSLLGNILSGTTGLMYGEKGAAKQLPSAPDSGGTSFICTMLRSKKLMNAKETFIMTQFMLKSMIQRSDFLVWYFKHGKKAVEAAEMEGFDWSTIKKLFVDDIIDLLKEGKFVQAQNLYIHRTGTFCSHYGVDNFNQKLATYRLSGMLHFPRLFFVNNCMKWLGANLKNIPKILTAKVIY
jgi:hypothetical protein